VPILYEVDRIRDGKSFSTRLVVAIQHGRAIFNMSARSTSKRSASDHQFPMPEVRARGLPPSPSGSLPWRDELDEWFQRPHPIDQRFIVPGFPGSTLRAVSRSSGCGCAPTTLPDEPALHAAVIAYASTCRSRHHPARTPCAGMTPISWVRASTTACGSTGRAA